MLYHDYTVQLYATRIILVNTEYNLANRRSGFGKMSGSSIGHLVLLGSRGLTCALGGATLLFPAFHTRLLCAL